jgi:hypothetical protein
MFTSCEQTDKRTAQVDWNGERPGRHRPIYGSLLTENGAGQLMEPNPQFTIDKALRPCRVTKALLVDLERSIASTFVDLVRDAKNPIRTTTITISDNRGEEKLPSAELMLGSQFHDSVSEVLLEMMIRSEGSDLTAASLLTVRLRFRARARPTLRIVLQYPRAREQAIGLEDRILRIMNSNFDDSRFFRAPKDLRELLALFAFAGVLVVVAVTWDAVSNGKYVQLATDSFFFWLLLVALAVAYLVVSIRYFPQCAFDSKRRTYLDDQKSWAKKAIWSLIAINLIGSTVGGALVQRITAFLRS